MISDLLTIVIPAKNEERYIDGILRDLSKQESIDGTRVIVADGRSTDSTISVVSRYMNQKNTLKVEIINGGTVSEGRNSGLMLVNTPFVLFIDADVRLTNTAQISRVVDLLKKKKLITAKISCNNPLAAKITYSLFNAINGLMSRFRPFAIGSFFATWTQVIQEHGGWDEEVVHSEDWLLSKKYSPKEFSFSKDPILVDDRRFRKMGYATMLFVVLKSFFRGKKYQVIDNGYWK
jgi:glycosyltransferase involved in cell wall biosynthesis